MSENTFCEQSDLAQVRKMLIGSGYSEKAVRYFIEKPYMGTIPEPDCVSEMTGTCGDTMSICLKVESGMIVDARYQVLGCPGAMASAMAVAEMIKGKTIAEARTINDGDVFRFLEEMPAKKHHCIQLAVKTLHKALTEYAQTPIQRG